MFDADYKYKQDFRYEHTIDSKPLKRVNIQIDREVASDGQGIIIGYSVPMKEFKSVRDGDRFAIQVRHCVVVFNEDYHEIFRDEDVDHIYKPLKNGFKREKMFVQSFNLDLEPGEYVIAVRIEDGNDDRIAIQKESIEVQH